MSYFKMPNSVMRHFLLPPPIQTDTAHTAMHAPHHRRYGGSRNSLNFI